MLYIKSKNLMYFFLFVDYWIVIFELGFSEQNGYYVYIAGKQDYNP